MLITNAAVIRLANAKPEQQADLLKQTDNFQAIIKKAKALMGASPIDAEQNKKLDDLIGACSLPRAKQIHGDAMELE